MARRRYLIGQSNLAIRNFLVALKLFLNTNKFLIKPFLIAKVDCTTLQDLSYGDLEPLFYMAFSMISYIFFFKSALSIMCPKGCTN